MKVVSLDGRWLESAAVGLDEGLQKLRMLFAVEFCVLELGQVLQILTPLYPFLSERTALQQSLTRSSFVALAERIQ